MSNADHKRPAMLGVFILVGIAMFVAGVFAIGNQEKLFGKKMTLDVLFDDVGGLQPGNNVWLSGVKVGTVKKIVFTKERKVRITLNIQKDAQLLISRDARARISTDGFIGNKIVVIDGGTVEAGMVASGDLLLSERGISTEGMLATLQKSNNNLLRITHDLGQIIGRIDSGKGTVGKLINDGSLALGLERTVSNLQTASYRGQEALQDIQVFAARLRDEHGLVNELISDTAVFKDIESAAVRLNNAMVAADTLMENLRLASNQLMKTDNAVGMAVNDKETANNLKEMIDHLRSGSQKLEEDLEALQHNFLLRGYFRKKKKAMLPNKGQ